MEFTDVGMVRFIILLSSQVSGHGMFKLTVLAGLTPLA